MNFLVSQPAASKKQAHDGWWAVLAVMFGNLAISLPPMIIYVALPDLMRAFQAGEGEIQWLVTGLQIASMVSLITTTWLVKRLGQRAAYICACALLIGGSLLGGLSLNLAMAIVARVLQGIACGIIPALSMVTVVTMLAPRQIGLGMSAWGVSFALSAAVTPYIGGILVEHWGWPSVFYAAIPLTLPGIILGKRFLAGPEEAKGPLPFDWLGLALLLTGVATFLCLPIAGAQHGWTSRGAIACMAACPIALVLFVLWQLKAPSPLFDLALFSNRRFVGVWLVGLVYDVGMYGTLYLIPLFAQTVAGYSPSASGSLMLPGGLVFVVVMLIAGPMCNRVSAQWVSAAGLILFALSCYPLTLITPQTSFLLLATCMALSRAGSALLLPALGVLAVRVTEPRDHASASVSLNFGRIFGGAIGSFALALFYERRWLTHFNDAPSGGPRSAPASVGGALMQLAKTLAIHEAFWIMTILFLAALIPLMLSRETIHGPGPRTPGVLPAKTGSRGGL